MKNLFSYKNFVNEKFNIINEAASTPVSLFKNDLKGLLDDMFAKVKKPEYEYDSEGFPTKVEFEIVENDFKVKYDKIETEFSEGVLKKRSFLPVLIMDEKEEEKHGDTTIYKISFKIQKEAVKEIKKDKSRSEQFEKDDDKQLLAKLKSKKVNDANKHKIIDILKGRGVKYKDPFDNDNDDDELSEEEMEKKAAKAAEKKSKKNESFKTFVEKECECGKPDCDCDEDEDVNEGFLGKIAKVLSKKEYEKTLNYCFDNCCSDGECCDKSDIDDCLKNMVFSKITKKALDEDSKLFKSLVDEIHKDCKKKCSEKNESVMKFGSEEWNKRYGIITKKEEEQEVCLDCLVKETLKNKKIEEYESLNEKINNTIEHKIPKPLETIKK